MRSQDSILQIVTDFLDKLFCHQDLPYVVEHLSREISWMGDDLVTSHYDEIVLRILNKQTWYPECSICAPNFQVIDLGNDTYSVNGTYLIHPDSPKPNQVLSPAFKASLILNFTKNTFKIPVFHYNPVLSDTSYKSLQDNMIFSSHQLNTILDSVKGGLAICRMDANFSFIYTNDRLAELFGYTYQELMDITQGYSIRLIYPPDLSMVMSDFRNILQQKSGSFTSKYRVQCKDGSLKWILDTRSIGQLKNGDVIMNIIFLDVTATENVQLLLEEQNQLLNNIYDSILCGIIRLRILPDESWEYISINKAAWTIMGYKSEEECRADGPGNFIKLFSPAHVQDYKETLLRYCNSPEYIEEECLIDCVDGVKRWVSGSTRLFTNNKNELILQSTLVDITKQRSLEQKLQEEQAEIYRLQNTQHTKIFKSEYSSLTNVYLEEGTYECEVFNTSYLYQDLPLHGLYRDLYHATIAEIHPDDVEEYASVFSPEALATTVHSLDVPDSISVSFRLRSNPRTIWLENTAFFILDGNHYAVSITNKNITSAMRQRQLLEEALASAKDASLAKSNFLSRMSHDIRTPLNAIMGMTAIASSRLNDKERVADCLNKISVSSNHLLGLINEVLDMSRIESGKMRLAPSPLHITALIDSLLTMVKPLVFEKNNSFCYKTLTFITML